MELLNLYLDDFLKSYYKRVFPSKLFCQWLSYGNGESFSNREFSFTLEDDVYIRYLSFSNEEEFKDELLKKNPRKIDIGAVYNIAPRYHKQISKDGFIPQWKELVFDIDMTDYDDARFCCQKADICNKCWPLMTTAIKILHRALQEDFGYDNILWVYSGRRGVHCWVSDWAARKLDAKLRKTIAAYLSMSPGSRNDRARKTLRKDSTWAKDLHPSLEEALNIIRPVCLDYLIDKQGVLEFDAGIDSILDLTPKEFFETRDSLRASWHGSPGNGMERWRLLMKHLQIENLPLVSDEIMLEFMFPRLDVNVTTGVNHLLKTPFSVHPGTGKICVPIDIDTIDSFDPMTVPRVDQLLEELKKTNDVKLTSVWRYIDVFERFVSKIVVNP